MERAFRFWNRADNQDKSWNVGPRRRVLLIVSANLIWVRQFRVRFICLSWLCESQERDQH